MKCHLDIAVFVLLGGDRARFLVQLSTREPLLLTVERIPDEIYWKRCCQEQLTSSYDVALHGGSWKRMYLERHLQRFIEKYVPLQTDMFDIKEILPTLEPFVKRLQVDELLAPTVYMVSNCLCYFPINKYFKLNVIFVKRIV